MKPAALALLGFSLALQPAMIGQAMAQEGRPPAAVTDPAEVRSGAYVADPGHTRIAWSISHLGYSTYTGLFPAVEGGLELDAKDPSRSRLNITVRTDLVGTLDPTLDASLKSASFFDTAAFPTATFKATHIEPVGKRAEITGDLTLKGVTRPVTLIATFNKAGFNPMDKSYSLGFDATGVIKRSDFGMSAYLPALGDEVHLRIEAEFKAQGE